MQLIIKGPAARLIALAVVTVVCFFFSAVAESHAASVIQWENANTGRCIDYSTTYGLRPFGCSQASFDAGYQGWEFAPDQASVSALVNYNSTVQPAACLDDSLTYGLRAYACNSASYDEGYQAWTIKRNPYFDSAQYVLENNKTGRCIDDSYTYGLRSFPCNDSSELHQYQSWWMLRVSSP